eukprot:186808-Chlamydomonas_euryale.AAC.3
MARVGGQLERSADNGERLSRSVEHESESDTVTAPAVLSTMSYSFTYETTFPATLRSAGNSAFAHGLRLDLMMSVLYFCLSCKSLKQIGYVEPCAESARWGSAAAMAERAPSHGLKEEVTMFRRKPAAPVTRSSA